MGITIHYTLITEDYRTVMPSILTVKKLALQSGYTTRDIREKTYLSYSTFTVPLKWGSPEDVKEYLKARYGGYREEILREIPEEPPWTWIAIDYPEPGYYTYAVPCVTSRSGIPVRYEGVEVSIPTAEPFTLAFYNVGRYYICDGFTKTQAFTLEEVTPNTKFHKWICHLLKFLEEKGRWWNFYVSDEAEYYDTLDESKIVESFEAVSRIIYGLATALDKITEELGGSVKVGGRIDIRSLREKSKEVYDKYGKRSYQSTLDDFNCRRIDKDG